MAPEMHKRMRGVSRREEIGDILDRPYMAGESMCVFKEEGRTVSSREMIQERGLQRTMPTA